MITMLCTKFFFFLGLKKVEFYLKNAEVQKYKEV